MRYDFLCQDETAFNGRFSKPENILFLLIQRIEKLQVCDDGLCVRD